MAPRIPVLRLSLLRPLLSKPPLLPTTPAPLPLPRIPSPPHFSPHSHPPSPLPSFSRLFSSSSSPSPSSNLLLLESENDFTTALNKVHDEGLHAIFYFTAVWCGPCKFISPVIEEMSRKFPHVNTYKIDIDQDGLGSTLGKLKIYSVPTLHFFQSGKKAAEVVGADVARLKDTMEKLYK